MAKRNQKNYKDQNIKVEAGENVLNIALRFFRVNDDKMPFSMTIEGGLAINGCRVIDGQHGLFVGMPSYSYEDEDKKTVYKEYVHPVSAEFREALYSQIIKIAELIWDEM